ncbi:MAG: hypothetical protein PF444_00450, partial [Bacteroidales bacterium]|nr:hypothetical protein [Bacteroidales bacterium]
TTASGENIGADGLTDQQWIETSRPNANPVLEKLYRGINMQEHYASIKKSKKAEVTFGLVSSNAILSVASSGGGYFDDITNRLTLFFPDYRYCNNH